MRAIYHKLKNSLEKRDAHRSLRLLHILSVMYKNPLSVPGKISHKLHVYLSDKKRNRADRFRPTYLPDIPSGQPRGIFNLPDNRTLQAHSAEYVFLAGKTLLHEFDLLGSGWVNLQRGARRCGVELPAGTAIYEPVEPLQTNLHISKLAAGLSENNRAKARELWKKISDKYTPISWNEDFKSGFIWPADVLSNQQKYGDMPGADIKVPWELARMHQLPWLAFAARLAQEATDGLARPAVYEQEFQNQILDFAAACPPGFGANWVCAMDVGIRSCNMLAAYDLFLDGGTVFPEQFRREFLRILNDHFEHITSHLEYQPKIRANHYYSDVVCLLILCAWMPRTPRNTAALSWAINEFFAETILQFQADGTNFEASTSYHRLCGELMLYALAVIKGLDHATLEALKKADSSLWSGKGYYPAPVHEKSPEQDSGGIIIPEKVLERAGKLHEFSLACRMEDKEVLQIGDNDSGRLFKFLPSLELEDGQELVNDHSHLLAAASAWTGNPALEAWRDLPDSKIIAKVMGSPAAGPTRPEENTPFSSWKQFPDFGLFFHSKADKVLAVRCGHNGQYDNGGHAHNDQLSISLACSGKLFLVDPGTYLYTPVPSMRNKFRATRNHNTLFLPDREQNDFSSASLFTLSNKTLPRLLSITDNTFSAEHHGYPSAHRRSFVFMDDYAEITDEINTAGARIALCFHPAVSLVEQAEKYCIFERCGILCKILLVDDLTSRWEVEPFFYSSAYGKKKAALRIISPEFNSKLVWRIY